MRFVAAGVAHTVLGVWTWRVETGSVMDMTHTSAISFLARFGCVTACSLWGSSSVAHAESLLLFECSYTSSASANVSSSGVQVELNHEEGMKLTFTTEPQGEAGQMIGNLGATRVVAFWALDKVTFAEIATSNTVHTTVIYGTGLGVFGSAHSRTSGGQGYELPSQWYGTCVAK